MKISEAVGRWVDLAIIILIVLLNVFWVPDDLVPLSVAAGKGNLDLKPLIDYKHPPQADVKEGKAGENLQAINYILVEAMTNKVLLARNEFSRIYPASTTKLVTAMTALNLYPLEEVIKINNNYKEGKVMGLVTGEQISVMNLVSGLLIHSANDAALGLASNYGTEKFMVQMNQLVKRLGLSDSHFENPDGVHNPNHYTTVYDLAQIARQAIKNNTIRQMAKTQNLEVSDLTGKIKHQLISTNELLGKRKEVVGLKTGWTPEAGGCFVAVFKVNGREMLSVVAQSPDRFGDTEKLINWAEENISWVSYDSMVN